MEGQIDPTYVYIYVYVAYTCVHMPIYVSTCVHLYACMCILVDRRVCYSHVCIHVFIHKCTCVQLCVHYTYTLVCHITHIYMHVFTRMCIRHVHTCMSIADIHHIHVCNVHTCNIHTISTHIQHARTHMHTIYMYVYALPMLYTCVYISRHIYMHTIRIYMCA